MWIECISRIFQIRFRFLFLSHLFYLKISGFGIVLYVKFIGSICKSIVGSDNVDQSIFGLRHTPLKLFVGGIGNPPITFVATAYYKLSLHCSLYVSSNPSKTHIFYLTHYTWNSPDEWYICIYYRSSHITKTSVERINMHRFELNALHSRAKKTDWFG